MCGSPQAWDETPEDWRCPDNNSAVQIRIQFAEGDSCLFMLEQPELGKNWRKG
jgi:hypothetical protein